MTFLSQAHADVQTFLDLFAEPHEVDGKTMLAIVDRKAGPTEQEGIYVQTVTLRVDSAEMGEPAVGQVMILGGHEYLVAGVEDEHGLTAITLVRNQS